MLINCPECAKKISSFSEKCLGCGLPSKYIKITRKNEIISTSLITDQECKKKVVFAERNS